MTLFITEKQVEEILSVDKTVELLEDAMKSLSTENLITFLWCSNMVSKKKVIKI